MLVYKVVHIKRLRFQLPHVKMIIKECGYYFRFVLILPLQQCFGFYESLVLNFQLVRFVYRYDKKSTFFKRIIHNFFFKLYYEVLQTSTYIDRWKIFHECDCHYSSISLNLYVLLFIFKERECKKQEIVAKQKLIALVLQKKKEIRYK